MANTQTGAIARAIASGDTAAAANAIAGPQSPAFPPIPFSQWPTVPSGASAPQWYNDGGVPAFG